MARVARQIGLDDKAGRLKARAAPIRDEILRRAWSEHARAFVESLDGEGLDAALLLMPEIGRKKEARALFERILALRKHVGLFSEDVDPHSRGDVQQYRALRRELDELAGGSTAGTATSRCCAGTPPRPGQGFLVKLAKVGHDAARPGGR